MNDSKEFFGKSLDEAIQEACEYFGVEREKLEIEIVNDAKTGIFGLVGNKKACIKACRAQGADVFMAGLDEQPQKAKASKGKSGNKPRSAPKQEQQEQAAKPKNKRPAKSRQDEEGASTAEGSQQHPQASVEPVRNSIQEPQQVAAEPNDDEERDNSAPNVIDICSEENVCAATQEVINKLVLPIVGEMESTVSISNGRIRVAIDCGDASGILVGREGQTLASVQYLAARLIAKQLGGIVRLQIDVGNYRERQDDKLREMALSLAEKVKKSRRTQATRPLSAYQRRIIHLTLEGDEELQTHSKGEGAQRRVIIQLRRDKRGTTSPQPEENKMDDPCHHTD